MTTWVRGSSPIPPQASQVNGITDDMVRGQRINEAQVELMLSACEFVIAPGTEKSWYTEVSEADANKEGEWLRDNVFGGHSISLPIDITDAYTRFSERAGRKQRMFV